MKRLRYSDQKFTDIETRDEFSLSYLKSFYKGQISVEYSDSIRYYNNENKMELHRADGPAVIVFKSSSKKEIAFVFYYLNDEQYSQEDWFKKLSKKNQIKYLFNLGDVE